MLIVPGTAESEWINHECQPSVEAIKVSQKEKKQSKLKQKQRKQKKKGKNDSL